MTDVAIIGAGPYGLSVAAHLRHAGLEPLVFGEPMSFWQQNMPRGMLLRSPWLGSYLSDPRRSLTLESFIQSTKTDFAAPIPLQKFVDYGCWFQQQAVPDVDRRWVERVERNGNGFHLHLSGGDSAKAKRVVIAAGIQAFPKRPANMETLPAEFVSHCSEHTRLDQFAGRNVIVIGGGQSALESAALLHEAGAKVEVLVRETQVIWLQRVKWMHTFKPAAKLMYAWPDVGPAGISHIIARPKLYTMLPRKTQDYWGVRGIRPAGAGWLKPRVENVPITTGVAVSSAAIVNGKVVLKLSDGSQRTADHCLLGTGYRVDVNKYPFLPESLLKEVRQINGYPQLSRGFESSIPRLHFVGAPAAWSSGPLMRFVAGAGYAARNVAQAVRKNGR